jgi:hypothetical protein
MKRAAAGQPSSPQRTCFGEGLPSKAETGTPCQTGNFQILREESTAGFKTPTKTMRCITDRGTPDSLSLYFYVYLFQLFHLFQAL